MRILVVQESDWLEVGPHDMHHLLERLSNEGSEVRVIDHHIRWQNSENHGFISRRTVRENYHKAIPEGSITVITPPFIRAPIADYLSISISHFIEIRRQIMAFMPDIIIGLGIINTSIAMWLARRHNIPFVHYVLDELHQLVPQEGLKHIAKIIEQQNLSRADLVISTNQGMRDYCLHMGSGNANTAVIRHGVELARYQAADGRELRKELGFGDDDVVLFFMGWLYSFSGLDVVARMIAESDDPRLKLLIVGNGELWGALQEIRKEDKLGGRIVTVGWKPYSEMPAYIAASDICTLPAQHNRIMENIVPIKIIEYMAARKPVIATELPGLVKEFGRDNGLVFINDAAETVPAAYALRDSGKLQEQGTKAQIAVKDNSWDVLVPEFKAMLSNLTGTAPPKGWSGGSPVSSPQCD